MTRPAWFALVAILIAAAAVALWFERHPCVHFERIRVHHAATSQVIMPTGNGNFMILPASSASDRDEYFCTERR